MKKLIIILIFALAFAIPCLSIAEDKADRLSQESSYTFSPGYINAAKYQADSFLKVNLPNYKEKGFFESTLDFLKDKLGRKTEEQAPAQQIANPVLQQKTGATNRPQVLAAGNTFQFVDSAHNVAIGTGDNKLDTSGNEWHEGARLGSEVFEGVRNFYAGFNNVGTATIEDALGVAKSGDKIIVRGGEYNEQISAIDGVSLYGGYDESGQRNLIGNRTTIEGLTVSNISDPTEIDGFTITSSGDYTVNITDSSSLTLRNNIINNNSLGAVNMAFSNVEFDHNTFNAPTAFRAQGPRYVYGMEIVNGAPTLVSRPNGPLTVVTSTNNNYYAPGFSAASGAVTITSDGDYFTQSYPTASIITSRAETPIPENTAAFNNESTLTNIIGSLSNSPYYNNEYIDFAGRSTYGKENSDNTKKGLGEALKAAIEKKNLLDMSGGLSYGAPVNVVEKSLDQSALPVSLGDISSREPGSTTALMSSLANPTDDQKAVIDIAASLVKDMDEVIGKDANANPELKKATDELLQAVANILLAQAIPDLLKEGDLANIKNIFSNLDTAKSKIMLEYNEATKPYYDEVKKIIEKNSEALYTSNVLQKNPLQKELEKLPPSQIDRIIEKLKAKEKRTFEEEYILQQEAKYREQYVEPNKKKLEESMKSMLQDFTKKLSTTLETTKKK